MRARIELNGKPITQKEAKEILGEERFKQIRKEAEEVFWEDPLIYNAFCTAKGTMVFSFS